ncbi:MAG: hypothetical protein U0271_45200 [Polyangiaceae bacterium]
MAPTVAERASASASADVYPAWPGDFVAAPSDLVGYKVFSKGSIKLSVKSYYVDNVTGKSTSAFPRCPSTSSRPLQIVRRGERTLGYYAKPKWIVHQSQGAFGVVVESAFSPQGEYGTQEECCISGDALAANQLRPTLAESDVDAVIEACLRALSRG